MAGDASFEPVNVPIAFEAGRFESNFQINLREDYYMRIELDDVRTTGRATTRKSATGIDYVRTWS